MDIILYSTNCPKCNILEKKLEQKNLNYKKITDFNVQTMISKGFTTVPILYVVYDNSKTDGCYYDFKDAVNFINNI